ncbi:hypothetical protein ElyMa_003126000 [Elysia marginata]|uniref:Uncharacterized protein n=1 Tax=Elysia marginata TaxID=1093978 RepID=A0AAV4IR24_9GAST|nr:hypothetical protein ElyMa_003126000 [Elysia marginata]
MRPTLVQTAARVVIKRVLKVESWFLKICPSAGCVSSKVRSLVESAVKKFTACDAADVDQFLDVQLHLDLISSSLAALGVNRNNIFEEAVTQQIKPTDITNQVVVDLDFFRTQEGLPKTFTSIFLSRIFSCEQKVSQAAIISCLKTYTKHRKNGTTGSYLTLPFPLRSQSTSENPPTTSQTCGPTQTHSVHTQTLYHTVEEVEALQNNVKLLKTVISELQQEKENLFQKSKTTCTCDCQATETAGVARLKRRVRILKQRVRSVKVEAEADKSRVLTLQKRCSALKKEVSKLKTKNCDLKDKVNSCDLEVSKLTYSVEKERGEINLKSDAKNAFSDELRQTVISLVCDAGVSAAKVSDTIQIVSENIFNYKITQPLPCAQTVVNMCDEGFVLSNLQVAQSIVSNDYATLHSDGTSRDGKKIVGTQLSLSDGSTLYLGFVPVATEDASTLLDITLFMFRRLANCFSELTSADTETLLRELLSKIKCTMTDRAAVMKLFASNFEDFLNSDLGINTQVHFLHCNAHFLLAVGTACNNALSAIEKEAGEELGRDKNERLRHFSKESETATTRLISYRALLAVDQLQDCEIF